MSGGGASGAIAPFPTVDHGIWISPFVPSRFKLHLSNGDVNVAKRCCIYENAARCPTALPRRRFAPLWRDVAILVRLRGLVLLQQADRATANQAWDWVFTTALIVLIAAVGALSGLIALGAMRDPKSRLGAWARKRPLVDVVQYVLFEAAMLVLILFGLWCLGIK